VKCVNIPLPFQVNGNSKATASLVVDEKCYKDNVYTVKSYFYGDIKVNLVNRKDNSLITHIGKFICYLHLIKLN